MLSPAGRQAPGRKRLRAQGRCRGWAGRRRGWRVWCWNMSAASEEGLDEVDRHREDGGARLLRADLHQGLEIAELERGGMGVDDVGRHAQLLRGLVLALGRDHLAAALALRLGLPRP